MKSYDELFALITRRGVHAVFGDAGEGLAIEQNAAELAEFLVVCQELSVSSVLEIGTGYRAGLARFLNDDMGWRVVSVDIHDYGHSFSGITFITGLGSVEGRFDLVIIDADHSYEAVKRDHEIWSMHATKVIAFHDIAGLRDCEGVRDYWNAIAYDDGSLLPGYHEIIADGDQRGGIGFIVLAEVKAAADAAFWATPKTTEHTPEMKQTRNRPAAKKPATPRKPAAKKKPVARTAKK